MSNSRTKNVYLIFFSSCIRQIFVLITTFVIRTIFIKTLGVEYLGVNGLFTNILSLLALSELGIGTAIAFYLYKPIENNDIERIKILMDFYKICYRIVGIVIICVGILIIPLLPYVVNFNSELNINLYVIYILYIINTASSYLLFAYKQTFLLANQQQYKVENVSTIFCVVQFIFDFINIALFKNFYLYLVGDIIAILIKNIMISKVADKSFPFLRNKSKDTLTKQEIKNLFHNIFSVSIFKIGSQLFNATDNIIISIILGTTVVGYYSNYYLFISYAMLFVGMIMKAFTAGIGNVSVKEDKETIFKIYKRVDFIMFIISTVVSVCMCQLFNSFMKIWLGANDESYFFEQVVIFILSFDFYINCSCQTANTFREATGNFKSGQWLQLIGGVLNVLLSLILGYGCGIIGIFLATIISKITITVTPFLCGIAKSVFDKKPIVILLDYYKKMIVRTFIVVIVWYMCKSIHMTDILGFVIETIISIFVTIVAIFIFYFRTDEFKHLLRKIKECIIERNI